MNKYKRAALVKEWREAFEILAREAKIPALEDVSIVITPYAKDKRWRADTSSCHPTAKASIDGLVDAGVMEDDNPDYLKFVGFNAPIINGEDALEMVITGIRVGESRKTKKQPYKNVRRR